MLVLKVIIPIKEVIISEHKSLTGDESPIIELILTEDESLIIEITMQSMKKRGRLTGILDTNKSKKLKILAETNAKATSL